MNAITYCEQPENKQWINDFLHAMKSGDGFDESAIIEAVEEQMLDEGWTIDSEEGDLGSFLAEWYNELDYPVSGAL
jgi:hypothetical protein